MAKTEEVVVEQWSEHDEVLRRRFEEAFEAGLTGNEAQVFATSNRDIGQLRKCVAGLCPPRLMARILL